jgi:hypothetical protein
VLDLQLRGMAVGDLREALVESGHPRESRLTGFQGRLGLPLAVR